MICGDQGTRTQRKGVTNDKKCDRCLRKEYACDGNDPCYKCASENHRCLQQGAKILRVDEKCRNCKNQRLKCDGGQPCGSCVRVKRSSCVYYEPDGHTERSYLTDPVRSDPKVFIPNDECQNCLQYYVLRPSAPRCDKKFPCNNCKRLPPNRACTYHVTNGGILKYFTDPEYNKAKHRIQVQKAKGMEIAAMEEEDTRISSGGDWESSVSDDESESELDTKDLDEDLESNVSQTIEGNREPFDQDSDSVGDVFEDPRSEPEPSTSPVGNQTSSCGNEGRAVRIEGSACLIELALAPEPKTRAAALASSEAHQWEIAMQEEYDSLIANKTWNIVDRPTGQKPLSGRWVLKRKLGPDGKVARHKARFVARGFEQIYGVDFDETYASVVKPPSYKLLFALQAFYSWKCRQLDIKTAFLNGDILEDVYIEAPDGFPVPVGKILKLNKALYGLKQSPRQWYQKLRSFLEEQNWTASTFDPSIFFNKHGLYMTIYVDDINIYGKEEKKIDQIATALSHRFEVTDLGDCTFYLGMHVTRDEGGAVYLHQASFVQQILNRFDLNNIKTVKTPEDPSKKLQAEKGSTSDADFRKKYQAMVGSLMYLMTVSRPDIAHSVGVVSRYSANPSDDHMAAVVRIYAYLKSTMTLGLRYSPQIPGSTLSLSLSAFADSDWGGCPDTTRSTTGWLFMLNGGPISWSSKRQKTVALSSCEAEYMASTEAAKEAIWLKGFIQELELPGFKVDAIKLFIDNNAAMKLTKNPEFHGRTKHITMRHHFIRERVLEGDIVPVRIDSANNLADLFTKTLPRATFERLIEGIGMIAKDCKLSDSDKDI